MCSGIVFILGLIIVFTGRARLGRNQVEGQRARLIGLILMLPVLISVPLGVVIGLQHANSSETELLNALSSLSVLEIGGVVLAGIAAIYLINTAEPAATTTARRPGAPDPFANVLTVQEAARYLRVTEQDVIDLINTGRLPAARIGDQYRIARHAIDDYLSSVSSP